MNQPIRHDDDIRLLHDLVATPSTSGNERAACERFVEHAQQLGLAARVDEAGNAVAHRGPPAPEATPHIALLGHIDTVPGDIHVRIEDGVLHGRGSVDAKGPLATMLLAAAHADVPHTARLTVIAAVGEETPRSPGARHVMPTIAPDACVIGEPSGWDGVTLGYKGRLIATVRTARLAAHTAGAETSVYDDLIDWVQRVRAHAGTHNEGRTREFDRLAARIQRLGGAPSDGMRETAEAQLGFRLPPDLTPDDLIAALEHLTPPNFELTFHGAEHCFATDRNDAVVRAISGAVRRRGARPKPKLKTGTADMNVVAPVWRCPIAAYGPGDSALDHTPHERLDLAEFRSAVAVLTDALGALAHELCADGAGHAANATGR